jgi:YidC/Oxa1 family membrane protein insertase
MNPFAEAYKYLVYQPQLNLLEFLFNISGDTGMAIFILAIIVNLSLWPLFAASYINSQKVRLLQPRMKALQTQYKDNQSEMIKQTMAFNRKHGIKNSSVFLVLFAQIFFASGLYFLINDVTNGKNLNDLLYPFIASLPKHGFSVDAFGFIPINSSVKDFIWLPLANAFLSFLYGMYSFRWIPKTALDKKVEEDKLAAKAKQDAENKLSGKEPEESAFDPESITKSMEFNTIYVMPIFLFFVNFNLPAGLNIYFTTVSLLAFVRQFAITQYYKSHADKLVEQLAYTEPENADSVDLIGLENATKVVSNSPITEVSFTQKKSVKPQKNSKKKR